MKKIETTVRPALFGAVKDALQSLGVHAMTVSRVEVFDRRRLQAEFDLSERPHEAKSSVRIDALVADDIALRVGEAIVAATRGSGRAGRILISSAEKVIELGASELNEEISDEELR